MADKQEVAVKPSLNTKLSYYANQYTGLMERDFAEHGLKFDGLLKAVCHGFYECHL